MAEEQSSAFQDPPPGTQLQSVEPLPLITIEELLSSIEVLQQKELADKVLLESIGKLSQDFLKTKLINWALAGFPNVYEIYTVTIIPPISCTDGVTRNLSEYILFCSGKSIREHLDILEQKMQNISVSFANMGSYISIVVSRN